MLRPRNKKYAHKVLIELSPVSKTDAQYAILIKYYIHIFHINIKAREKLILFTKKRMMNDEWPFVKKT